MATKTKTPKAVKTPKAPKAAKTGKGRMRASFGLSFPGTFKKGEVKSLAKRLVEIGITTLALPSTDMSPREREVFSGLVFTNVTVDVVESKKSAS